MNNVRLIEILNISSSDYTNAKQNIIDIGWRSYPHLIQGTWYRFLSNTEKGLS